MAQPEPSKITINKAADEHAIELVIGNLLRICVVLTIAIVMLGAILYLPATFATRPSYAKFTVGPAMLRVVPNIISAAFAGDALAIIQSGMLLLILTPILRVAFSVAAFLYEKDYLYVVMTLIVLGLLTFSLSGG
jgi:uncharacterized membrane protein